MDGKYLCSRCNGSSCFSDISKLLSHVSVCHSAEPNFSYPCVIEDGERKCCKVFHTVAGLKTHVYREHRNLLCSLPSSTQHTWLSGTRICCPVCSVVVNTLSDLSGHYRVHFSSGQKVVCVMSGCTDEFDVYSSYTSHMSRCHKNQAVINVSYLQRDDVCEDNTNCSDSECSSSDDSEENVYTRHIALFLLKLQESCMLPCSTIQTIVDGMKEIVTLANKSTLEKVNNVCTSNNICPDIHKHLIAAASDNVFDNAFSELETDWKRKQYYKENCHFVEPQTIRYNPENPLVTDSFQYISLLDSLRVLLQNKDILSQILAPVESKPHIVSSFSDGVIYQQHPIYQAHPKALQLVLYADEFDVVNPLGVHASVHKILAFYFTIANISRHLQSKKDVIQLLALCNSSDVKSHGLKAVADIIFDDIQVLEQQGIEVPDSKEQLYGSVVYIVGDNLNSHMIGGFNGSFGPKVVCLCRWNRIIFWPSLLHDPLYKTLFFYF